MRRLLAAMLAMSLMSSPVTADARTVLASWYKHGKVTANGERFNPDGLTAAHKKLPFGTILLLTYGTKSVIVRINDRGPFIKGRELDLSMGAAKALGCIDKGVCRINMTILD
jgi:rare lipoprotein A